MNEPNDAPNSTIKIPSSRGPRSQAEILIAMIAIAFPSIKVPSVMQHAIIVNLLRKSAPTSPTIAGPMSKLINRKNERR